MNKQKKIKIAVLLCTVFVFRVLFANLGALAASNPATPNPHSFRQHVSTMKRWRCVQAADQVKTCDYQVAEICEEDGEDDKLKPAISILFTPLFFSPVISLTHKLQSGTVYQHLSVTSFQRYLTLRVFRI